MSEKKFYLTTPIYYVNARPHIGHAYTTLVADTIARRHRLLGDDTFFLTGTDEHGQKIERSAAAAGIPPQQFTDQVSAEFRNLWDRMGLTYDDYIRTTEPRHQQGAQRLFEILYERGQIYLSSYTGNYSVGEEIFVEGPPGVLGPDGKPTETVTEENFFFRLSEYQLPLIDLIESDTLLIQPESRKNEVLSFLRGPVSAHLAAKAATREAEAVGHAAMLSSIVSSEVGSFGTVAMGESSLAALDIGRAAAESSEEAAEEEEAKKPNAVRDAAGAGSSVIGYSALGNPYVVGNLRDLSVSRSSFTWGIPVPEPAASETKQKHVIYVWLDALANYMTAVGYGSDKPEDIAKFERYWPADVHIMAKEITRQHCIYWPAFLLAAGLPLPKAVTAHGWLLFDDSKMSKSKGNIVRTETILDAFGSLKAKPVDGPGAVLSDEYWKHEQDLFASDVLRYFLLREIPFGQDGSFSFDAMITRYNADLANGYGNLVSRTLNMISQNCGAGIPSVPEEIRTDTDIESAIQRVSRQGQLQHPYVEESFVRSTIRVTIDDARQSFYTSNFSRLAEIFTIAVGAVDAYLSRQEPWKLAKQQDLPSQRQLHDTLYIAAESIRIITALFMPILPNAAAKVWKQLGFEKTIEQMATDKELDFKWGGLKPGTKLGELGPIFPRADKGLAQIMTDMENPNTPAPSKLVDEKTTHTAAVPTDPTHPGAPPRTLGLAEAAPGTTVGGSHAISTERPGTPPHTEAPASGPFAASAAASATPDTPQIAIDDFVKIDLRVAQIVVAERIPKADKLLRLEVDLGYEKRQILSGIAEWYTPEELIGRRIVVIANLAPRKMRGLESHGMLLAASAGENGKPVLATFGEEIALGSRLK